MAEPTSDSQDVLAAEGIILDFTGGSEANVPKYKRNAGELKPRKRHKGESLPAKTMQKER